MPMGCAFQRFGLPVAILALLGANGTGTVAETNPAAPIAAAAGHPARRAERAEAIRTSDGAVERRTLEIDGDRRLERVCRDGLCSGTWFDGMHAFAFGINGTPFAAGDADDRTERTFTAIVSTAFGESDFIQGGGTVRALPPNANGDLRFAVAARGGDELVAFADPRTLALRAVESPDGELRRPLIATTAGGVTLFAMVSYDRIDSAAGAPVPPSAPAPSVGGDAPTALLATTLPIVRCRLAGRPARCLLDTGTTPSAVTLAFAESIGQEPRGGVEIGGLDTYLTGVIDAGPLEMGAAVFDRLHFAVIPRSSETSFDAIVGSDVLAAVRVAVDVPARQARIDPRPGDAGDVPGSLPLVFRAGVPEVAVRLGASDKPELMLLDTGDVGTLSIGYDRFREDFALFAVRGAVAAHGTGPASTSALVGEIDRAEIGGRDFAELPIGAVRGQHIGHVGFGLWTRCFPFVVDLGRSRLVCGVKSPPTNPSAGDR